MKQFFTKILLFIGLPIFICSCDATKRIGDNEHLLTKNTIYVEGEETGESRLYNFLYQKPISKVPIRLHLYNLARPNIDSILDAQRLASLEKKNFWSRLLSRKQVEAFRRIKKDFNSGLKNAGDPPSIVSDEIAQKSAKRLSTHFINNGYFNTQVDYEIKKDSNQRATIDYHVDLEEPYVIDNVTPVIPSKVADSIYWAHREYSFLKKGERYKTLDINRETQRLEYLFRNNGLYHFEADRIRLVADTVNTGHRVNLEYYVDNRSEVVNDSIKDFPYKVHKVSEVNIVTDYSFARRDSQFRDSLITEKGYQLLAFDEIKYKSKAITDKISITPGDVYRDIDRTQTLARLSRLGTFKYPSIEYSEDPADSSQTNLIATIRLTPLEKYKLRADFDASTSNIQDIGIAGFTSLLIRNLFKGSETLEISARGSIGASNDASNSDNRFFNIAEIGADANLTFPRIFSPFNTTNLIPAAWQPFTRFNLGVSFQQNIGLDKQSVASAFSYNWQPSRTNSYALDLLDVQYVRNLNPDNFFNIYRNTFDDLNAFAQGNIVNINPDYFVTDGNGQQNLSIPFGAQNFENDVSNGLIEGFSNQELRDINAIAERQERLTEDNLIVTTNFNYTFNNRENLFDDTFTRLRARVELAGNLLSLVANAANASTNDVGNSRLFGVIFSQYVKTELDFVKHWDLGNNNVFAARFFGGAAIPYGNSSSIPFIESFFAGGSNDIRAWQAYDLGPGSSGGPDEFNEANLKLAANAEYRFNLLGPIEGALFTDIGNIWNVLDNVEDEGATFEGLNSLNDIAIGSGFGLRWDFDFVIFRFDTGFKTYNPARSIGNRWFREYNFANAVYNIGINYPF